MKLHKTVRRGALAVSIACLATPILASTAMASPPSAPATPTSVSLTSGNRSLAATWLESSTGTITYTATAKASGKSTRSCVTKKLGCTIVALTNGVVYDVTVTAKNSGGTSFPSSDMTSIVGVPGAPNSVHATSGTALATIKWAPPKASGVSNISGYMATASPGGFSCSTAGTLLGGPARTCQIAGLTSSTKYTVTVTATNAYGTGIPSKGATVTPS